MRRFVIAFASLLLFGFCAGAQNPWWLFPGKKNRKVEESKPKTDTVAAVRLTPAEEVTEEAIADDDELWLDDWSDEVKMALILPFNAQGKARTNYLEMYSGALMALGDLGNAGTKIALRVFDSAEGDYLDADVLNGMDLIIGPVDYNGIAETSAICGKHKMVVSPLDPNTASLVENGNVIQSPSGWTFMIDEMVDWLAEELAGDDEVVVIRDNSAQGNGEQSNYLVSKLAERNITYRSIPTVKELDNKSTTRYRLLIASDNDQFITNEVRNIGISANTGTKITLYSTSRIRNCVGPDVFDLYTANARLAASYYVDYEDPAVKDFILKYRALFASEPGSFAFQGYDLVKYYVSAYSTYGRRWYRRLPEYRTKGLQSDFMFDRENGEGRINTAVRRVVYNPDLSISLL